MPFNSALVRKLNTFVRLSSDEMSCLEALQSHRYCVNGPTELMEPGQDYREVFVLQNGWGYDYKLLSDGRRQIFNFYVPGDIIGLRSILLRRSDHFSRIITSAVISNVPTGSIAQILHDMPRLGSALLWAASRDEAILAEHLVDLGRRSAVERMAHLFLELSYRLRLVGHASELGFACPLRQEVLADALGLSLVHVNRVLQQLREHKLVSLKFGRLIIHDTAGMKRLAAFDESYLDQDDGRKQVTAKKIFLSLDIDHLNRPIHTDVEY